MVQQTVITQEDFIQSVADAFQYISFYHPPDYIKALHEAYLREESPAARDAIAQILINSRMAAEGHRPICQDTGICIAFVRVGMGVRFDAVLSLEQMVNEGVRRAYTNVDNPLRGSMLADPDGERKNTTDNTPGVTHVELVPGNTVEVIVAAKGGGSENKSKFAMLLPSDNIVDWVLSMVPTMGADWCPPGMLSLGVGGSPEKAMLIAKWAMMEPFNMHQLMARGPANRAEQLRIEIFQKVNALGIGAQGLGGLSTVLDVKVADYPTHAASKPVALLPNCAATRHAHFTLDGSGPATLATPSLEDWPKLTMDFATSKRINIDAKDKLALPMNDVKLPVSLTLNKIILAKAIEVKDILYDYSKFDIRPDAAIRLDTLVQTLVDNPKISIELSSHTDSRGKDAYNLKLSQQRAQAAVDYIVSKGVDKARITAKGYGETRPLVQNAKTEEEYQRNRRTEFRVTRVAN